MCIDKKCCFVNSREWFKRCLSSYGSSVYLRLMKNGPDLLWWFFGSRLSSTQIRYTLHSDETNFVPLLLQPLQFSCFDATYKNLQFKHFSRCWFGFSFAVGINVSHFTLAVSPNRLGLSSIIKTSVVQSNDKTTVFSVTLYQLYLVLFFSNFENISGELPFLKKRWILFSEIRIEYLNEMSDLIFIFCEVFMFSEK